MSESPSAPEGVQAVRGALRDALARDMDPAAWRALVDATDEQWKRQRSDQLVTVAYAEAAIRAGWRLVSEDDDTIDRVARALHADRCDCGDYDDHLNWVKDELDMNEMPDVEAARAAVRALREET